MINELSLRVLFTTDEKYTVKRSVYSKSISTTNSTVNPSQYLSLTVDAEEKRQLEQQLNVKDFVFRGCFFFFFFKVKGGAFIPTKVRSRCL